MNHDGDVLLSSTGIATLYTNTIKTARIPFFHHFNSILREQPKFYKSNKTELYCMETR